MGLLGAGAASAHAHLESISPADGATVPTPPGVVTLVFDEPVTDGLSVVKVTAPSGATVSAGTPTETGAKVSQRLAADLPAGKYTIAWKAVSDDGHPVSGTATFTAAESGGEAIAPSSSSTSGASSSASSSAAPSPSNTSAVGGGDGSSGTASGAAGSSTGASGLLWLIALALVVFGLLGLLRAHRRSRALKASRDGDSTPSE